MRLSLHEDGFERSCINPWDARSQAQEASRVRGCGEIWARRQIERFPRLVFGSIGKASAVRLASTRQTLASLNSSTVLRVVLQVRLESDSEMLSVFQWIRSISLIGRARIHMKKIKYGLCNTISVCVSVCTPVLTYNIAFRRSRQIEKSSAIGCDSLQNSAKPDPTHHFFSLSAFYCCTLRHLKAQNSFINQKGFDMPTYRAVAVSALILCTNVEAFAPLKVVARRPPEIASCMRSGSRFPLRMSTQTPEINFYKVLGVTQDARESDIKAAYRKLAKLYHPGKLPLVDLNKRNMESSAKTNSRTST
jgi:DnaJ domain